MYYDKFHRGVDVEPHTYLVEGIGEDFYPTTCDLTAMDDMLRITDLQCYSTARKLTRMEGIFTGSSGGAAVWGALEYAKRNDLGPEKVVVVLVPDHGLRYLSKVYSETWLRENGMLESQFSITASELLKQKRSPGLVSVAPDAPAAHALQLMKEHSVSQIPVVEQAGDAAEVRGSVLENQLLDLIVEQRDPKKVKVSEIMQKAFPVVGPDTKLEEVAAELQRGAPAVLVKDTIGRLGIITKYDLIAQIAR
jgi:cystathionine beta-synthase